LNSASIREIPLPKAAPILSGINDRLQQTLGFHNKIAWRSRDIAVPGLDLFTFCSRKHAGAEVAAQNGCLATINELALAARAPGKDFHHCVLLINLICALF
jgi:hypothetical protein